MLFDLSEVLELQIFTVILFIVYSICMIYKRRGILSKFLSSIKNDNTAGILTILISGCLPIPGRIVLCSSILKSFTKNKDSNTGIAAYIGTHHYYLWSPMEKSVIIVIGGMGISYINFLYIMWVPLLVYCVFMVGCLRKVDVKRMENISEESEISTGVDIMILLVCLIVSCFFPVILYTLSAYLVYLIIKHKCRLTEFKHIDYKAILFVSIVLVVSSVVKQNHSILYDIVSNVNALSTALVLSFIMSYILGSSSKFAGVCLIAVSIFGVEYLCLFYTVDFCGYMLSPCHKCRTITQCSHDVKSLQFNKTIGYMCLLMVLSSSLYTALCL